MIQVVQGSFNEQESGDMMRSRNLHISDRNKAGKGTAPSLLDLCIQTAIDNIRYIGNVGPVASDLLERILPHCTVEQLMHIENATSERDLSPETDKLWKKFYEAKFGAGSVEMVEQKLSKHKATFTWRQLYQAKLKDQDEAKQKSVERLAQLYKNENARKQSRQIQICAKVPPSSKRRAFGGGFGDSAYSNVKSTIMKKAKVEHSVEMKNRAAVRKIGLQQQRSYSVPRPQVTQGKGVGSYSRDANVEMKNQIGLQQQRSNSAPRPQIVQGKGIASHSKDANVAMKNQIGLQQQRNNSVSRPQTAQGKGVVFYSKDTK